MIIAHISDPHFGQIERENIVEVLVEEVNAMAPDLVAVSGDLTQRARTTEFASARAMLDALPSPTIVVPGNHDVFPWWNPIRRLTDPLRRYRQYVTDDLQPTFEANGVAVLGINSAHGRTIKEGRISARGRRAIRDFFGTRPSGTFNVLVLHHHLTKIDVGYHGVASQADAALDVAVDANVDLILCGHLHISHIEPVEIVPGTHRLVVASAGTATSTRGRRWHRKTNFFNRIAVDETHFSIEERRYVPADRSFVRDSVVHFDRNGR